MNKGSIAPLIRENYPEYYLWNEYPADECIVFTSVKSEWGILGNFYPSSLVINGVEFVNSEQLFQMMKFSDSDTLLSIYNSRGMKIKYAAKSGENKGLRRPDWGKIIIDCMKFCLQSKYEQCSDFRKALEATAGFYIVEDQSGRKTVRTVDTWGAVRVDDKFIGSNLLGRLLIELRNNGRLEYNLPDDMFEFIEQIKNSGQL